ncbi:RHS repeat-associated core domain-containing protein [Candidatus Electrothrix aarhusensis]|uniref:RHS repeat-associated core domain-containing protein n=1 Tax=Candidatus Electrothrix aarhusensis TaxID=1859131 RepID=A0A444J2N4_9BACT|nr:RHS repeat-associated core domain-containing protein [Candidatus Electrothrix aarhusensis]
MLWTPASQRRYFPDGSYEVVAEPPQYFGKGWTSELGQYLLEIDMAPTFEGVQILYPDGHTANFEKSGSQYVSASPGTHDVVTKEGDEYILRDADCGCASEEKRFNSDGHLTALVDRNGNAIRLFYDGDKLSALENAAGRRVEFTLNNDGQIIEAQLPENISLQYEYQDDLLSAFIDGRGNRTEYRYDELGQMTEIISANGYPLVRNIYDDEYRVTQQIVKESESYSFSYEEGKTTVTDAYGNAHVHHYDDDLRLVRMEYPDGTEERYEYDEDQNRTGYTNQAGGQWQWTYDDTGNRLTAEGPLGWYRDWAYNKRRQVTRMTEKVDASTQRTSTFIYDEHGNLTKFCNALNACGFVVYDERGLPLRMTDLNSYTTVNTYDTEGDLIRVLDPEGAMTDFDHDNLGRVTGKIKPLGNSYNYSYDENSNLTSVDGPLGFHLGYSYDANDNLMQSIDPNGGTINYTYTESDSPKEIYNQLNFKTSFSYGLMNERTGMTDAENRVWSYAYNSMLRVTDVNGPLGYQQDFVYNALGMITDATDPEGRVKHIEYDALKRPLTITRNYVAGGVENSDTNVSTSFTYNLIGDRLSVTDPEGYISTAEYDLQSRLLKKQDAEGYAWEYSYDPMGNLLEKLNPRHFTTSYAYTPTNRLQSVTNPEQHIKSFTYNPNGSLITATDPKGTVSEYAYDELDRKIAQVRNSNLSAPADYETNVTTAFAYDLAGNLRFVTNPLDHRKELRYDAAHRKVELIDYEEGSTTFTYDKVNNLLKVTDAEGNSTDYAVDDLNHLIAVTNAEKETIRYTYNLVGNRTQRIEADNTVTLYELDGVYRLNRVQENYRSDRDPGNDVNVLTTYGYDRRGLLTSFINANGAETTFAYNRVGKLTRETDPLLRVWEYAYDGNRNRITGQDAKGNLTEYDFYPDDMLMRMAYADGTVVSYAYDANNNRTAMSDTLGDTSWNFDPLNRVTQQDDPFDRSLHYQYDAASNRVGITYPDENQVGYAYSPNNWLQNMTVRARHAVPLQTEYARDLVGNLTEIDNPNQTRTTVAYDKVYRTLRRDTARRAPTQQVVAFEYTYNEVGHITKAIKEYGWRKPSTVVETYGYDGLHRLSEFVTAKNNPFTVVLPSMQIITGNRPVDAIATSYSYDPVGNRLSWESTDNLQTNTPRDGFSRSYAYNEANQMLGVEYVTEKNSTKDYAYEYSYDENGNRINRQLIDKNGPQYGVDYSYDAENRLVAALDYQITSRNGKNRIERAMTHYEYDGGGRRLVQHYDPKNGGVGVDKRDEYVFDGLDPVAEYDILNGQRTDYYRGAGNHLALMHHYKGGTQGQMYWYHYNHKGDVVGLTKQNGNSHHNYRYDPYGAVLPENGNFTDPHNHYTLTGKEFDENTGLVWFGARFYEPESGVWVNQDVYRGRLSEPGSLHRYGYVTNNPVTLWDWYGFKNPPGFPIRCVPGKTTYAECYDDGNTGYMIFEDDQQIDSEQFEELQRAVYDNLQSYDDTTITPIDKVEDVYNPIAMTQDVYDQLTFDTPFYNPYYFGWVPLVLEVQVPDTYVCIDGRRSKRSNVNYFAMGMYYARMGKKEEEMNEIIYWYKKKINGGTPDKDTLYWARKGHEKYRAYKKEENRKYIEVMESVENPLTTTVRDEYEKYKILQ